LPGTNFYRLKIEDIDGKYIYSEVRSVNFNKLNNIISISPNPAKNLLRLRISAGERLNTITTNINIYSSSMQLMQTLKVTHTNGNAITIPVDRLTSGIYFLQFVNASGMNTIKFLKE
jgi:Secretion system C-terminal sorting domain